METCSFYRDSPFMEAQALVVETDSDNKPSPLLMLHTKLGIYWLQAFLKICCWLAIAKGEGQR